MKEEKKTVVLQYLLVVALLIFATVSPSPALGLERRPPCPPCGNISVPYPLSTSPSCGEPGYRLYCKKEEKVLEYRSPGGNRHRVLSVDPASFKFVISPPQLLPGSCVASDLDEGGLVIDDTSPFNISNENTVLVFNCSKNLLLSPLNCSSTSVCRKLLLLDDDDDDDDRLAETYSSCRGTLCCSYLKDSPSMSRRLRIRAGGCTAYSGLVALRESDPPSSWTVGIELQWLPLPS